MKTKNLNISILVIFLIIISISCTNKKDKNTKIISQFLGKELLLNDSLPIKCIKQKHHINTSKNRKIRIISYINAKNCFNCLEDLKKWKKLMNEFSQYEVEYTFYINHDWKHIKRYMLTWDIDYPIVLDKQGWFKKKNNLPKNNFLHTFLINKKNKIILIGNLLKNKKLKSAYKKKIIELTK